MTRSNNYAQIGRRQFNARLLNLFSTKNLTKEQFNRSPSFYSTLLTCFPTQFVSEENYFAKIFKNWSYDNIEEGLIMGSATEELNWKTIIEDIKSKKGQEHIIALPYSASSFSNFHYRKISKIHVKFDVSENSLIDIIVKLIEAYEKYGEEKTQNLERYLNSLELYSQNYQTLTPLIGPQPEEDFVRELAFLKPEGSLTFNGYISYG